MNDAVADYYIERARRYWDRGQNIPLDLLMKMQAEGLDVVSLEHQYMNHQ